MKLRLTRDLKTIEKIATTVVELDIEFPCYFRCQFDPGTTMVGRIDAEKLVSITTYQYPDHNYNSFEFRERKTTEDQLYSIFSREDCSKISEQEYEAFKRQVFDRIEGVLK